MGRLRNVCPHLVELDLVNSDAGNPALHYLFAFETQPGTLVWCCMRLRLAGIRERGSGHAAELGAIGGSRFQRHGERSSRGSGEDQPNY